MKGARHLAKRSSVDDRASVPAGERGPSTRTEAQVLGVCTTYYYTQEILLARINLKDWSTTLGLVVSICFLGWVAHMCREADRGSRTAGDSRMQKGRKPWPLCSAQISCSKNIYPSNYLVSVFFLAFLFWRSFLFKSYFAVSVSIKCQT